MKNSTMSVLMIFEYFCSILQPLGKDIEDYFFPKKQTMVKLKIIHYEEDYIIGHSKCNDNCIIILY